MFIFFTVMFFTLALYAVFTGGILRGVMLSYSKALLKQTKDESDDKSMAPAIGITVTVILMIIFQVMRFAYISFALKHDPLLYPTLAMLLYITGQFIYSALKDKFKKPVASSEATESDSVLINPVDADLEALSHRIIAKAQERKAKRQKAVTGLEKIIDKLKKRSLFVMCNDVIYILYFGYMLYMVIFHA